MIRQPPSQPTPLHFLALAAFSIGMAFLTAAGTDQRQAHRMLTALARPVSLPPVRGSPRRRRRITTSPSSYLKVMDYR
ncbi:hypothetical protein [Geminicoccus roseus]|uniref:hypothetical protein n=1 Tax=Geminicoccus roseus TaxID=404900 RepID=UPI0004258A95|nr:hypothetical protein [Geminicoccus roseus]